MKTIKGATGSKSNLLRMLALPILMLVAFLNIEIGGGSTPGSETRKSTIGPDIGGNSAPKAYTLNTGDIGGGQETRKSPIGPNIGGNFATVSFITSDTEIGGQGSPRAKPIGGSQTPPRSLVNVTEIGGPGNQYVPRDKPFGDIGGTQTAPRGYAVNDPIGDNNGNERRKGIKPYSPPAIATNDIGGQNQQKPKDSNPLGIEIGGNSVPRSYATNDTEIGGNGGPIGPRNKPGDIGGGQTVPRPFGFISSFLQDCTVDIGGNQTVPRLPFDIGGNGGGSTAPRNYSLVSI